ncbi:hypothetical protein PIB30_078579 [Stylosanthes scabra]|uniref:GRF-type domain-containing protein n=1 Tax=Stylosanthes scabra TaxID=79078 RepID=A0ABU6WTN3_9FABA|nr:hypothetical protein [Stylosanthes scabra]
MASSRERWSSSNHDGGREAVNGNGWSGTLGSSGSDNVSKKRSRFVAPECNYGTFAILFMSSTIGNPNRPNRLFYGCPYFKSNAPHCKFFAWLDDYVACCEKDGSKLVFKGVESKVMIGKLAHLNLKSKSVSWRID